MLKYKRFIGKATFDAEAPLFHGEVLNSRDVITFQSLDFAGLETAFHESVDDYLEFCRSRDEEPSLVPNPD